MRYALLVLALLVASCTLPTDTADTATAPTVLLDVGTCPDGSDPNRDGDCQKPEPPGGHNLVPGLAPCPDGDTRCLYKCFGDCRDLYEGNEQAINTCKQTC